jgi:hypothetical protein
MARLIRRSAHLLVFRGFGADPTQRNAPTDDKIAAALLCAGWRKLVRDGAKLQQPGGLRLDLNGVAKGYAVDQVNTPATRAGVPACLVEMVGEIQGYGVKSNGQPWWAELEQSPGAHTPRTLVALFDLTIATSGDYQRNAVVDGHIDLPHDLTARRPPHQQSRRVSRPVAQIVHAGRRLRLSDYGIGRGARFGACQRARLGVVHTEADKHRWLRSDVSCGRADTRM